MTPDQRAWLRQPNSTWVVIGTLLLAVPFVIAMVVASGRRWFPVLDLAMTELRVRDVGSRRTPLVGLPGRIGEFPEQGSHPGPISFYLWAVPYRVFGSSAWALQVASAIVNLGAVTLALTIGARRGGRAGIVLVAAMVAVAMRGFGIEIFTQPWNPYAPLLFWLVVLLATWSVLCGDHRMTVVAVVAATFCIQTHVPYLALGAVMVAVAVGAVAVGAWRADAAARRSMLTSLSISGAVAAVLWLPPLVDQLRRRPGNLRMLVDHFSSSDEPAIGLRSGGELMLRHLDPVDGFVKMLLEPGAFVTAGFDPDSRVWAGALVLCVWLAAAVVAVRMRDMVLLRLHVVVAAALAIGALAMSRIFGKVWYYLTLWAWVTAIVLLVATVWTFARWVRGRLPEHSRRSVTGAFEGAALVVAAAAMLGTAVEAADSRPPEAHLSDTLGAVLAPTIGAIEDGTIEDGAAGDAGRHLVTWTDAYFFGSQGYGLVNELERAGYDAGVLDPWRVPVTPYRVMSPDDATVGVHLATGIRVEEWRARPDAVEVAVVEPRSPVELAEYDALRSTAIDELRSAGLDELVDLVDSNLFLVSNDPRVSRTAAEAMARMLILGQETAVFFVPPGTAP